MDSVYISHRKHRVHRKTLVSLAVCSLITHRMVSEGEATRQSLRKSVESFRFAE